MGFRLSRVKAEIKKYKTAKNRTSKKNTSRLYPGTDFRISGFELTSA